MNAACTEPEGKPLHRFSRHDHGETRCPLAGQAQRVGDTSRYVHITNDMTCPARRQAAPPVAEGQRSVRDTAMPAAVISATPASDQASGRDCQSIQSTAPAKITAL